MTQANVLIFRNSRYYATLHFCKLVIYLSAALVMKCVQINSSLKNAEKMSFQPITKLINAINNTHNFADDFCLKSFTQFRNVTKYVQE